MDKMNIDYKVILDQMTIEPDALDQVAIYQAVMYLQGFMYNSTDCADRVQQPLETAQQLSLVMALNKYDCFLVAGGNRKQGKWVCFPPQAG